MIIQWLFPHDYLYPQARVLPICRYFEEELSERPRVDLPPCPWELVLPELPKEKPPVPTGPVARGLHASAHGPPLWPGRLASW